MKYMVDNAAIRLKSEILLAVNCKVELDQMEGSQRSTASLDEVFAFPGKIHVGNFTDSEC